MNLKCGAAEGELLRARYPDILPGFYSDKRTWISCLLDGELPEEVLRDLCGRSYALAVEKLPKYVRRELAEQPAESRGVCNGDVYKRQPRTLKLNRPGP